MGRTSRAIAAAAARAQPVLQKFDPRGQVSPRGDALANLLNVDWSGLFARDVLTANAKAPLFLRPLYGQNTVSVPQLLSAYEPILNETVQELLELNEPVGLPLQDLHDPVYCCANFGWQTVLETLSRSGTPVDRVGENGMSPRTCAEARGWTGLAAKLPGDVDRSREAVSEGGQAVEELLCEFASSGDEARDGCSKWSVLSRPAVEVPTGDIPIPEVDASSLRVNDFDDSFFKATKPVVIRGAVAASPALCWSPDELASLLQDSSTHLSTIPYPDDWMPPEVAQQARRSGTMTDAIEAAAERPNYLFMEVSPQTSLARRLDEVLNLRGILEKVLDTDRDLVMQPQFSVGQSGTGAPWHWHQDAINACLIGERVWYLRPPPVALMSNQPVTLGIPEAGSSYFAVQRPGDIIYIPDLWSHAVVNRVLSVAVSVEFGTS
eukprot:TRINITY_DN38850_c0_g1_i2.p1 TRINITY_DN38850_c0_g1~~TRINITY_DN38850_c0_g1_i2.p1  ORF type:complete len:455 (+),score=57.45 TRINITY_DN38850_c0_g1_i2:60-1367(+)